MKTILPQSSSVRSGALSPAMHSGSAPFLGKSTTFTPWPSIAAMELALQVVGIDHWTPQSGNQFQHRWNELFTATHTLAGKFSDAELVRKAAPTAEEINEFMARHGFPEVTLDPFPAGASSFGIAAVLKVAVKWTQAGTSCKINDFDAAHLKQGVGFWRLPDHGETVVQIGTQSSDTLFLTMEDRPLEGFDLWNQVLELSRAFSNGEPDETFNEVKFPKVKFDEWEDVSQLCGIQAGPDWFLAEAKQKTRFKMNELGAKVESAFAGGMRCTSVKPPPSILEINRPFLVWLHRPGLSVPVFAGRFCPDSWNDPGTF